MSRSWAKGSTRRWRKIRAGVLAANQHENAGRCVLAIKGVCTTVATEVHHVRGKQHGDRIADLVPCCKPCNLRVGSPGRISPEPRPVSKW